MLNLKNINSKNIWSLVFVIIVISLIVLSFKSNNTNTSKDKSTEIPKKEIKKDDNQLSISIKNIKEDNFTGTMPVISGSSKLATEATTYVEKTVSDFRKQANTDVPDMRAKFGADAPMANYTIDIQAKHLTGTKTDAIVISSYTYTGGANGNSAYHVINASHQSGTLLALSDVIKTDKQIAFTTLVKKELNAWIPKGSDAPVVFPDEVKALIFSSLTNWSLDDKNLTIYFDKYQIGPGVLGAVAFPVPLAKMQGLLNTGF